MGLFANHRALLLTMSGGVACLLAVAPAVASTPALPDWPAQTSVYAFAQSDQADAISAGASDSVGMAQGASQHAPTMPPSNPLKSLSQNRRGLDHFAESSEQNVPVPLSADGSGIDSKAEPAEPERDFRRLAAPKDRHAPLRGKREQPLASRSLVPDFGLPFESIYTTGAAMAIVIGLFLLCAWVARRAGLRRSAGLLPDGVVSVLGRVPLTARQTAELVRVGNKLVLLSVTPSGVEPLTEITDPVEIDRLLGLCQQRGPQSATAEFDAVFRQLATETNPDDFLGHDPKRVAVRPAAEAYAAYRGGAGRG